MSDLKMEIEQLNGTKPGQDYYVHLLVGITETRLCLATLREYVLSVWQGGDQSDSWQPAQRLLVNTLAEQFELQQRLPQDDTQLVANCLQSLKHKVINWDREMQLHCKGSSEKVVAADKKYENCTNNNNTLFSSTPLQKMAKSVFSSTINNGNNISPHTDNTGHLIDNQVVDELQKQVKDLTSQLESQQDEMNSLLRANRNYKDDYRNKVRSLNRSMALKMAAMNRAVMEAIEEGSSTGTEIPFTKCDELLRRITSLSSQLSEKKREVQTLKTVVNYNRCSSDNKLKKLQDELDDYKEQIELTKSVHPENPSFIEDGWKDLTDLQTNLAKLEQENTNLRHLLSLEVDLLNKYNEKTLDRRHSLPGVISALYQSKTNSELQQSAFAVRDVVDKSH